MEPHLPPASYVGFLFFLLGLFTFGGWVRRFIAVFLVLTADELDAPRRLGAYLVLEGLYWIAKRAVRKAFAPIRVRESFFSS